MEPLVVNNLTKTFFPKTKFLQKKSFTAVNDISFKLNPNEILGILGPNGAGKTTTIQMLLGILTPNVGEIIYFGKDFFKNRSEILKKVSFASAYDDLPARLTVQENLDLFGRLYGLSTDERKSQIKKLLGVFDIGNLKDQATGSLSAGQTTRTLLAKAFLPKSKIVLLDEPTSTLDPEIAHEVRKFILECKKQFGMSILFTSHNMDEVTELCDRVLVLKNGKIIADNTPLELAASVANSKIHLLITQGIKILTEYLEKNNLIFLQQENQFTIEIDEQKIGTFLAELAKKDILYSQISIDKPTLEEYFLSIIKNHKNHKNMGNKK